jgi:nucleoside triphosphate pyrophosphatase
VEGSGAQRAGVPLPLVLASSSPQRRAILRRLGVRFTVREPQASELVEGDPETLVSENALRKARAVRIPERDEAVLGCDTVVALGGTVYGKPSSEAEARETLRALSGAEHEVLSGLALLLPSKRPLAGEGSTAAPDGGLVERLDRVPASPARSAIARTAVTFRSLGEDLLEWYLATGEWRGRAGGYAIQGAGAALVRSVQGDYENVVGLPLATLLDLYPELLSR